MGNREGYYEEVDKPRKAARYQANRDLLDSLKAGKICEICGSTTDLEFDHLDRNSKAFSLGQTCVRSTESILAEVTKCRLICRSCHWGVTHKQHEAKEITYPRIQEPPTGVFRICSKCKTEKDMCEFNKNSKKRRLERGENSRLSVCKDCEQTRTRDGHAANKVFIDSHKVECADCGSKVDLEFDHVRGEKFKGVAMMKSYTRKRILEEIAKCDVVCRPCHMIRTAKKVAAGLGRKPGRPRKNTGNT